MKILLVSPHFPPRFVGGVEFYTKRLADYLHAEGHQPEVICVERIDATTSGLDVVCDTTPGYPVHRLSFNTANEPDPFRASYHHARIEEWGRHLLDEISPDVLHLHSGYLLGGAILAAAESRRVPTVVTLHDFWFVCARITLLHPSGDRCTGPDSAAKCAWCLATAQRRYRLADAATGGRLGRAAIPLLERRSIAAATGWGPAVDAIRQRSARLRDALGAADLVLAPSRFLRDLVVDAGIPTDRVTISRYGIDVPAPRARVASTDVELRIGYLGQFAPHKGVAVLVEAVRQLPDASIRLHVFGDPTSHGGYAEHVRALAAGDERIEFRGAYKHEQVYDILAGLDAIVVPSVWYENAPFVIQEAQAAHVPVLASRLGGMRELVTDEVDGLLFEAGNARDLARQLTRLLDDRALLKRLTPDGTSVRTEADEMRELSSHYRGLSERRGIGGRSNR